MRQFRLTLLVAAICLFGQLGMAQDKMKPAFIYDSSYTRNDIVEKTRGKALLFALLPGSLIHGAGHFYAGSYKAGNMLFLFEIFSGILLASGYKDINSHTESSSFGLHPGIIAGYAIFLGTWFYDILAAPNEADEYNWQIGKSRMGLSLDLKNINCKKSLLLGFSYRF